MAKKRSFTVLKTFAALFIFAAASALTFAVKGTTAKLLISIPLAWSIFGAALITARAHSLSVEHFASLAERESTTTRFLSWATLALILIALLNGATGPGDAALYASQIEVGDLEERAIHWGYFLYAQICNQLIPGTVDLTLNIASAIAGCVGLLGLTALFMDFTGSALLSSAIAIGICLGPTFLFCSLYANSYLVQAVAGYWAFVLFRKNKPFLAGLVFGYALTVSIASIVLAPLFLLPSEPRHRWRDQGQALASCFLGFILIYGLFFCRHWPSLLYGDRGLLDLGMNSVREDGQMLPGLLSHAKQLVGGFPVLLPFAIYCLLWLLRNRRLSLAWLIPTLVCLALYLVTSGGAAAWGFLLPVIPLLFLPIAAWAYRREEGKTQAAFYRAAIIFVTVVCNAICSMLVWPPSDQFRGPASRAVAFANIGARLGPNVYPLGEYTGAYLRANRRLFLGASEDPVESARPGEYVIMDESTLLKLESQPDRLQMISQVTDGKVRVWHVRLLPKKDH